MTDRLAILTVLLLAFYFGSTASASGQSKKPVAVAVKDTVRPSVQDSASVLLPLKFKSYKQNVHASYYADKFNGRNTASGTKFNNNKYTAAHRKFPFGTKLRITNKENGKFVIVEVTDRGPFVKGREIDITKRAFKEICDNKTCGGLKVTIDVVSD